MTVRIQFDISDEAAARISERVGSAVPISIALKETVYKLVDLDVEPDAATRRRLIEVAARKAKLEVLEQELSATREVRHSLV
jgi:hypothetical protein